MFRYGGSENNVLYGSYTNDQLYGNGGNDTLDGGAGRDYIYGGQGQDVLYGGADGDLFVFNNTDANNFFSPDWVMDFQTGVDKIDLRDLGVYGQTFRFGALDGSGPRVTYEIHGPLTSILADWTGDGQADFHLIVANWAPIDPRDFLL